ncbi:MAG: toll/interleukin-1 receptor domain-containing protein [Acidobacteriota bacterium]|nr:toll/interleukin-1 receptor domain-containing protein [Acidobacteriota bacterium]
MNNHNVFGRTIDESLRERVRVFISHRAADKEYARAIANYFENIGLHYYFDEQDEVLLEATRNGHSEDSAIVEAIDRGLAHSTHLLAVLSRRTMGSWWVPFEIGSARASGKALRHLLLPSITADMVPEYLRIYPQFWNARDLSGWVSELTHWRGYLVNQQYGEYLGDIFGELDPDEETVAHWHSTADRWNNRWLVELDVIFKKDS